MKQLLILSGKGGTGKTTVAGAFIEISKAKAYADCDVDAPNLHLIAPRAGKPETEEYFGLPVASVDEVKCTGCGLCAEHCRFDAVEIENGTASIDRYACEGCGVCAAVCREHAVSMLPDPSGKTMLYQEPDGVFSTAHLYIGKGASGKLVTEVKKRMKSAAPPGSGVAVIDGSPGIGCPVIASLAGVDMVLIVAEPSVSGISDLERIAATARGFGIKSAVCVNKHDISPEHTVRIENLCKRENLDFVGTIPFDPCAVTATNDGLTVVDTECEAGKAVHRIYRATMALLADI